jgi:protein arginine kinase
MAKWYKDTGMQSDIVLSTRVRLARNLKGIPFPIKATKESSLSVIDMVEKVLQELNMGFSKKDISTLSQKELQMLVEERVISPKLAKTKLPCAVFVSEDDSVSIMVNEEDHLRMQAIFAGQETEKAYDIISRIDEFLADRLDYAIHEKYGYLTSCPTNVGTGMRVSYMMHLPAIVTTGIAESLFSSIGKLGVTVRGMYGEGTKAGGYIFQISNQTTLGNSEEEIMGNLSKVAESIISKERELRTRTLKDKGIVITDQIMRSYGILKNARIMQSKEMMTLISNVRLGIFGGTITDIDSKLLNTIMIETSPAHLMSETVATPIDRDIERARIIRNMLKEESL